MSMGEKSRLSRTVPKSSFGNCEKKRDFLTFLSFSIFNRSRDRETPAVQTCFSKNILLYHGEDHEIRPADGVAWHVMERRGLSENSHADCANCVQLFRSYLEGTRSIQCLDFGR